MTLFAFLFNNITPDDYQDSSPDRHSPPDRDVTTAEDARTAQLLHDATMDDPDVTLSLSDLRDFGSDAGVAWLPDDSSIHSEDED